MMPRYTHSETGALVALCVPCWMKLTPYLTRQEQDRRKAVAIAAVEVQLLETMWELDGSWIKEGVNR